MDFKETLLGDKNILVDSRLLDLGIDDELLKTSRYPLRKGQGMITKCRGESVEADVGYYMPRGKDYLVLEAFQLKFLRTNEELYESLP